MEWQQENLAFFNRVAGLRKIHSCLKTGFYKTLLASDGAFVFERYLAEGRDFFGKQGTGAKKIVFVANRSDKPLYVTCTDSFAGVSVTDKVSGWHPPLSENIIFGGFEKGSTTLGLKPYSVAFIIY